MAAILDAANAKYIESMRQKLADTEAAQKTLRAEYVALNDALKLRKPGTIRRLTKELKQKSVQIVSAEFIIEDCKYEMSR
jgi:transcription initiation factor IIE alpha subunit